MTATASVADWKNRYLALIQEQEAAATERAEVEALLRRIVTRLTLAVKGLDENLDPHLEALREALRNGVTPELKQHLNALADALVQAPQAADAQTTPGTSVAFCERLIHWARKTPGDTLELERLCQRMGGTPERASDRDFERLLELLKQSDRDVEERSDPSREGFFQQLMGAVSSTGRTGGIGARGPKEKLQELLDGLEWPPLWEQEIARLRQRLIASPAADAWQGVLSDLAGLMRSELGRAEVEIRDTEGFLAHLTARLAELDRHMRGAAAQRRSSLKSSLDMSSAVQVEMGGIETSMAQATDLGQLRQVISLRLDSMQSHMAQHLEREKERFQRVENSEKRLKERLLEVEKEAHGLHRQIMETQHLALRDPVTELPNRQAYDERLAQEFARWQRFREPLVLMVWDVDNFKGVNDRYGHQAGDKALRVIAQTLILRLREADFIARYGGEEFVVMLFGADSDAALGVAQEMRDSVAQVGFHSGDRLVPLTISCGLAQCRDGDTAETLFARADKALYRAKRQGKNCCIAA